MAIAFPSESRFRLEALFRPKSVAVVGADSEAGRVAFGNLLRGGFNGPILPVAGVQAVEGVLAYSDVASLPVVPDLTLLAGAPELAEAALMALGAALATGRPQACAVVPGPGLLNAATGLLTAYAMNAPVLGLVGQIPHADIGRGLGHLHEMRDQAGIIERIVDHTELLRAPERASRQTALALRGMRTGRPGPAVLECAIDVWGKSGPVVLQPPLPQPRRAWAY